MSRALMAAAVAGMALLHSARGQETPGTASTWTMDTGTAGLRVPEALARVVDRDGNAALLIDTDQPHHTTVQIAAPAGRADFLLSARVRVEDWRGRPPVVYLYGRRSAGGFRGLQFDSNGTGLLAWYGQNTPSRSFPKAGVALSRGIWVRLVLACIGDYIAAKSWVDGAPEPGWQVQGMAPGQPPGGIAFGVWTHPRDPSSARVLFDDVALRPLTRASTRELGLAAGPRPPLPATLRRGDAGPFTTAELMGLRTAVTAIAFDRASGDLAHVTDRRSGQEFIAPAVYAPLFRLTLYDTEEQATRHASARDFARVTAETMGRNTLRLHFADCVVPGVEATVAARIEPRDATLRLRLAGTCPPSVALTAARFPEAPAPPALSGDGTDDRLLLPWMAGGLLPAPGKTWARRTVEYPGACYAQFSTLYNQRASVYWALYDGNGHNKKLVLDCAPDVMSSLTFTHLTPEVPGADWAIPYDVVLTTYQGDWYDAADRYRAWAETQPWGSTRLSERTDIPDFLKAGSGIIIVPIANPEHREHLVGSRLEKLPDLLDRYRDATGLAHMVCVPYGWENRGTWAGIHYFPAVPSDDDWRRANAELLRRGHRTAFMTSGFWWVVRRQETGSGPAFDDTALLADGADMCIRRRDGALWDVDNYERTTRHGSWRGYSVKLCHGSARARDTMKRIFLHAAHLGVSLVSFDQQIGGAQQVPCYAPEHGHASGWGNWMWTDFRGLCTDILDEGKPVQPELGLFLENVSELAIPKMATYWSRQFGEVDVATSGDRGIGLFSYLYHDRVTAIGAACVQGQGKLGVAPDALLRCRVMANNLTRGLIPGPFQHEVPLEETRHPFRSLVRRAYFSFCRPYRHFPEHLVLGRAVRPPAVSCGSVDTFFYRQDGQRGKPLRPGGPPVVKVPLTLSAVTAGSFRADDGSTATVVANSSADTQTATVALPRRGTTVFTAARTTVPAAETGTDPNTITLALEPFGVRVLLHAEADR